MKRWIVFLVLFGVLWCVPLASAQRILIGKFGDFAFNPFTSSIIDLGLQDRTTVAVRQDDFLDELQSGPASVVIVRSIDLFEPSLEDAILTELETHVAGGGKLLFQMAELDRASRRYMDLLGLEAAVELELPLLALQAVEPRHPSMPFSGLPVFDTLYPPDYGDELVPQPGFREIIRFVGGGSCTIVGQAGRVIVNGHQWDNWSLGGVGIVRSQILWLLRCPADLDMDGATTINDFLVFQNLFDAGDPSVDFHEDGRLDVFDFLAFFNQFQDGC